MLIFSEFDQVVIAVSIVVVWVLRFDNIVLEFEHFKISNLLRNAIGASKIALSTLLVAGIWYPRLVLIPAILMGLLMVGAQWTHFRVRNPLLKFVPSLVLLILSAFVAVAHA
jgi:hypothetical protein